MKYIIINTLFLFILSLEIGFFLYRYTTGDDGYKKLATLQDSLQQFNDERIYLKKSIDELEIVCESFKKYPYYKEKIVREELQMIKESEIIYTLI